MFGGAPIGATPMIGDGDAGGGDAGGGDAGGGDGVAVAAGAGIGDGIAIGVGAGLPRTWAGGGAACVCGTGWSIGGNATSPPSDGAPKPGAAGEPVGAPRTGPDAEAPRSSCPDVIVVVPTGAGGTPPALDRTLPCWPRSSTLSG